MSAPNRSLLELSVQEAVERMARAQLGAARRALPGLADPGRQKARHAFRVAIRRTRSLLRAYRPWLGKAAGRKVRRRLRDVTRATNAGRDVDVQLALLAGIGAALDRDERAGLRWLVRHLQRLGRDAMRSARARVDRDFGSAARLLRRRLADEGTVDETPFRQAVLEVMEPTTARLLQGLDAVAGADDDEGIHRARTRAKHLRYLVEPLRHELAEARDVIRPLKKLQVLLGELRDVQVLEEEIAAALERASAEQARRLHRLATQGADRQAIARALRRDEIPGLIAIARRARERRDVLYQKLRRSRQASRDGLQQGVESLARALRDRAAGAAR
jgi:CHAD domain-containing protein